MTPTNAAIPSTRRNGVTLFELIISLTASSFLLVGIGSSLYIATQATDPQLGSVQGTVDGSQTLCDLAAELGFAQSFTERTATSVEFTVADRTGDTNPETIRYAWSGTLGDPLTRQFNGGAVIIMLENVYDFNLDYQIKTVTSTETQTVTNQYAETMFANFEGWSGITPTYNDFAVGSTNWCAEFFNAGSLPDNTSKVTITRCQLKLKQDLGGNITVGIHWTKGGGNHEPRANPIGTPVTVPVSTLPTSYQWVEFTFSDVTLQQLNKDFVVVVKADMNNAAQVQYLSSSSAPKDDPVMVWTTDSGAGWDPRKNQQTDNDMYFRVWGSYETSGTETVEVTRYVLASTGLTLQVGSDAKARTQTSIGVLNRPEVTGP